MHQLDQLVLQSEPAHQHRTPNFLFKSIYDWVRDSFLVLQPLWWATTFFYKPLWKKNNNKIKTNWRCILKLTLITELTDSFKNVQALKKGPYTVYIPSAHSIFNFEMQIIKQNTEHFFFSETNIKQAALTCFTSDLWFTNNQSEGCRSKHYQQTNTFCFANAKQSY